MGKAYGKRTFSIVSFQPVPAGTEGAVSLEGTAAGWLAATVLTTLGFSVATLSTTLGITWAWAIPCWIAAILATTAESWIGATIQDDFAWMTNEVVNGIQTTIAAILAICFVTAWQALF